MSRRRVAVIALCLAPPLMLAAAAGVMHSVGLTGVDSAAHAYKIEQLRHGLGALFWDSFWYGGTYGVVGYGLLYYLCALIVPGVVLVVIAAGALPLLFHQYMRKAYGVGSLLPAAARCCWLMAARRGRPWPPGWRSSATLWRCWWAASSLSPTLQRGLRRGAPHWCSWPGWLPSWRRGSR